VTSIAGCHPGRKPRTILYFKLRQDVRDMSLDRLARQEQRVRDVRIAGATRDEIRDLPLAVTQDGEVIARSCAGPASLRPDAQLAQELVDMGSLGRGPNFLGDRRGVPQDCLRSGPSPSTALTRARLVRAQIDSRVEAPWAP
jgi:hypothetical protein